jgi:hypothetical protein
MSLLPVPQSPLTNHVSWTWTSPMGSQTWTISGPCAVIRGPPFSWTMHPAHTQSLCVTPLANFQRPVTRSPPSARIALPAGSAMPAVGAVGSANTSRAPPSGV